jgi:hypothetical protein
MHSVSVWVILSNSEQDIFDLEKESFREMDRFTLSWIATRHIATSTSLSWGFF